MAAALSLSAEARQTAGVILLTLVAVESGGLLMLRIVGGRLALTPFQRTFFRAGHAHAGVLVILALLTQLLADAARLPGVLELIGRNAIAAAAVLMPAGFFLSALGRERTGPSGFIVLLYAGVVALAAGAVVLGVGLLTA